jgi:hypothetical protein
VSSWKNFALPGLALLGIILYWIWRSSAVPVEVPAAPTPDKAAPPAKHTPRDPSAPNAPTTARDAAPEPTAKNVEADPPRVTERDRRRTDALREQLRSMGRSSTSRGGGAGAGDAAEPAEQGTLDRDYIKARIQEDLVPIAKECYESALEDDPKLGGKLVMKFAIVGDEEVGGVVEEADVDATSDIKHPDLLECMKESMLALSFAPPEGGGRVEVTYPFTFASDGPPAAEK